MIDVDHLKRLVVLDNRRCELRESILQCDEMIGVREEIESFERGELSNIVSNGNAARTCHSNIVRVQEQDSEFLAIRDSFDDRSYPSIFDLIIPKANLQREQFGKARNRFRDKRSGVFAQMILLHVQIHFLKRCALREVS